MTLRPATCALFFASMFTGLACGSGTNSGVGDGGVAAGPGVPVMLPDGTTVPTVACGDENVASIAGTWNLITSGAGTSQGTATMTIDANTFTFASSGRTLAFAANGGTMSLQWLDNGRDPVSIALTHADSPVSTGVLPLALGGQWTFRGMSAESCTSALSAASFATTCNDVHSTPVGRLDGTVTGTRTQQLSSAFGDLGGTWHLTGSGTASVDVTISGNTLTAVVNGHAGPAGDTGWITVKACNGSAAGKTSGGFEIAGTRS